MRLLERRLEAALDRAGGRSWRRRAHTSELAGAIIRTLDLSVDSDGRVPNRIVVPSGAFDETSREVLSSAIEETVTERGWRIDGPVTLIAAPVRGVSATIEAGELPVWAVLDGGGGRHEVRVNRAVLGRGSGCDVVLADPSVSRRHARLWRSSDRILLSDLASANGTRVDGAGVGSSPVPVQHGSLISMGEASFRFRVADRA